MSQQYRIEELEFDLIVFDEELQVRVETNQHTIHEYFEAMETAEDVKKFPPPTVYFDGCRYWLADGHHRYWAILRRGYKKIIVKVIDGTHDDALLAAVKLNSQNGLRFNNDDWEKIIPLISGKEQWKGWSNRRLAEELKCSHPTVQKYRSENSVGNPFPTEKRQGKDGKMYKSKKPKKPKSPSVEPPQLASTASEVSQPPCALETPGDATQTNNGGVTELAQAAAEADLHREKILNAISELGRLIDDWFTIAPPELHEDFDSLIRERIAALIT